MYVAVQTMTDEALIRIIYVEIRKAFANMKFSLVGLENRGWQIRLESLDDEAKPVAWSQGFIQAWNVKKEEQHA